MALCSEDVDCPGNLVCYVNVSWNNGKTTCDCDSVFYGWTGEDCLGYGPSTWMVIITSSMFALVCGVLLISAARIIFERLYYRLGIKLNATSETFFVSIITILSIFISQFAIISVYSRPETLVETPEAESINGIGKTNLSADIWQLVLPVALFGWSYNTASILTVWIDLGYTAAFRSKEIVHRLRIFVKFIKAYLIIMGSLFLFLVDKRTIIVRCVAPLIVIATFFYWFGKNKLVPYLIRVDPYLSFMVQRVANINIACTLAILFGWIINVIFAESNPRDYIVPGSLSPVPFVWQGLWLCLIIAEATIFWYLYRVSRRAITADRTAVSTDKEFPTDGIPSDGKTQSFPVGLLDVTTDDEFERSL